MYKKVALVIIMFSLFSVIALGIVSATPSSPDNISSATPSATPQSEADDSFEFLIAVLRDANRNSALTDEMGDALANWFIKNRIAPETEETYDEISQRLAVDDSFEFLIAVLRDADENGLVTDRLSGLLSDIFIENLVAPKTGETPEEVELRLFNELGAESVSVELPVGWSGFLRHPKGAIMDIVERSTSETTTMEITEARMSAPSDGELAGRTFYFTVGDIALDRSATLYIPYQPKEDQDTTNVVAALWVDGTAKWEIVGGIVNEDTRTVEVTTTRLGIYGTLFVSSEQAPNPVSGEDTRTVETATSKMSIIAPPLAALGERGSSSALVNDVGSANSGQESSYYDLARRYAPVLRIHPDEQFRPRGVEGFIAQASLKKDNVAFIKTIIPRGEIDDLDQLGSGGYDDRYFLDVPDDIQDPPDSDYPPKVYFTIRENIDGAEGRLFLQYYLFYYNESGFTRHEADWELIQLEFIADSADEIIDKGLAPVGAAYSQHWWAEDRTWDRVEKESGHPVCFRSLR